MKERSVRQRFVQEKEEGKGNGSGGKSLKRGVGREMMVVRGGDDQLVSDSSSFCGNSNHTVGSLSLLPAHKVGDSGDTTTNRRDKRDVHGG